MIGRKKEAAELNRLYQTGKAEFVAIYGRRRIGKTYLVDEVFKNKFSFRHAGLSPAESNDEQQGQLRSQLEHFYNSLKLYGMEGDHCPSSWLEAFFMLEKALQDRDDGSRQLVFIDELPWLDTPRSGFVTALEGFWNTWACHRSNFMLVVCGSANSWILDKLINNHGGLYGRVTYEIKLSPFSLAECEEFFKSNNILLSRYDITQSYMILGGIPYYLGYFQQGLSLAQNIDSLFFRAGAVLREEFSRLFSSVFDNPEWAVSVVRFLNSRSSGYSRKEIAEKTGISSGSTLTAILNALIASDFVIKYVPLGLSKREAHYKLVDPYCLFYLRFVENQSMLNEGFWQQSVESPSIVAWRGLAFENVCFTHIDKIKAALGISGVNTSQYAWSKRSDDTEGAQIDLIIERKDNVINMCEAKFYSYEFTVDGTYYRTLMRRQDLLSKYVPRKMVIHNTLITTYGLVYNEYSGIFSNVITLDDFFS